MNQELQPPEDSPTTDAPASDFGSSVFGVVTSGTPEAGERARLAAMVFTDVVGYSKRMGENEEATIAAVHADFTRMRELCAKHGGEVLNTMGDGMMLSFDGAVAAMKFALEMQTEFAERNGKLPNGKGLQHRIGIHIGDVYRVIGGHMAGDGVNIAARLEPKAPHGGVAISQIVYDTVRGKVQMKAERMGPQTFKNIAEPIVVWKVTVDTPGKPVATPRPVELPQQNRSWPWLRRLVWVVVLLIVGDLLWPYRDMLMTDGVQGLKNVVPLLNERIRTTFGGLVN
ncbi:MULTISPECIES: adenylate/guanylate cyclase domain-containing protein [Ramlibacter]|uniref:Adenylate/guanylate cyclase domain-containing protein n=1 Tax=Ramlibacter aquaticus TaxID=2780094 RepID=A0ABR9SAX0_9BURK|nr:MULTISPECIES: adenylate/guanylate cyclase domain-containing protein [Ramlibacter]MBE7939505.1 adenylate/guanylate cyclase domain-containing protein [Ramlibacter aquaticus]